MILELAFIEVLPANHEAFEAAVKKGVEEVLSRAPGFIALELQKGIERAETYNLHIHWETLEDHTVGFRESELFGQWRAIIGVYFANPPVVQHWSSLWRYVKG